MIAASIESVYEEMRRAKKKHGESYMGAITKDAPEVREVLEDAVALGREAKFYLEERGERSRFLVLLEEVGEVAEGILDGDTYDHEIVQVAAMACAWLGIEPPEVHQ